jgi:hypothetical protein
MNQQVIREIAGNISTKKILHKIKKENIAKYMFLKKIISSKKNFASNPLIR